MQNFYVISLVDIDFVDFNEIVQDRESVRYSNDGSKFIIKSLIGSGSPDFISSGSVVPLFTFTSNTDFLNSQEYSDNWVSEII